MSALDASSYYFFSPSYYEKLFNNHHSEIKLVQCKYDDEIACTGIFSFTNGIVQYHLGGTASNYFKFAPTKLMFDYVREYASELNYNSLHLGGGLGGKEDNLYNFKRGFSDDIKNFYVLKKILNQKQYDELSQGISQTDFFPLYRTVSS